MHLVSFPDDAAASAENKELVPEPRITCEEKERNTPVGKNTDTLLITYSACIDAYTVAE